MDNEYQNNKQEEFSKNTNSQNTSEDTLQETTHKKDGDVIGPVVGSIIVIILIILGGIYYWGSIFENRQDNQLQEESVNNPIIDQGISEIESEIDMAEIDNLDEELNQIEAEIESDIN